MEPFAPFVFQKGAPFGPGLLLKRLHNEISDLEAEQQFTLHNETSHENDKENGRQKANSHAESHDPLQQEYLCASCLVSSKGNCWKKSKDFGVQTRSTFAQSILAQGAWKRCLHCQGTSAAEKKATFACDALLRLLDLHFHAANGLHLIVTTRR